MESATSKYRVPLLIAILLLFGVGFALESIGNHLNFRTYGLDLGLYTKTLYDHAHLRTNDGTLFLWRPNNQLGGHFDLYLVLFSPLVYLFGNYTLLLLQIGAVLVGMWGMYRLARLLLGSEWMAMVAMLLLGLSFGVWHALGYDYHSNVVSAMLLPWLVYNVRRCSTAWTAIVAALMAIAVESSALWVVFVLLALVWDVRADRPMRRLLLWTAAACGFYFCIVTLLVMPALGGGGGTGFWRYQWMGDSVGKVAVWLLAHPVQAVAAVFSDFAGSGRVDLKVEFFLCWLASGMLLACLKPNYLLMVISPLAIKMLSADTDAFWGVNNHYNAELCAVAAVGAVEALGRVRRTSVRAVLTGLSVVLAGCTLYYTIDHPRTPIHKATVRILDERHYDQTDFDPEAARRLLRQVPPAASVCATTMFSPHLATRDSVYIFPFGLAHGAKYYLLAEYHWCYRDGEEDLVHSMIADTVHYRIIDHGPNVYLLEAISLPPGSPSR